MCLLKRAKTICSNNMLYNNKVSKFRFIFLKNSYPNWFFENALLKFDDREKNQRTEKKKNIYSELAYHILENRHTNSQNVSQLW